MYLNGTNGARRKGEGGYVIFFFSLSLSAPFGRWGGVRSSYYGSRARRERNDIGEIMWRRVLAPAPRLGRVILLLPGKREQSSEEKWFSFFFPFLYALDQSHSSPRVVVARRDALKMEKGERVIVGRGGKGSER